MKNIKKQEYPTTEYCTRCNSFNKHYTGERYRTVELYNHDEDETVMTREAECLDCGHWNMALEYFAEDDMK